MPAWTQDMFHLFWQGALSAIPLALMVWVACRIIPCRPATRHTLWVLVLVWFVAAPLLTLLPAAPVNALVPQMLLATGNAPEKIPSSAVPALVAGANATGATRLQRSAPERRFDPRSTVSSPGIRRVDVVKPAGGPARPRETHGAIAVRPRRSAFVADPSGKQPSTGGRPVSRKATPTRSLLGPLASPKLNYGYPGRTINDPRAGRQDSALDAA